MFSCMDGIDRLGLKWSKRPSRLRAVGGMLAFVGPINSIPFLQLCGFLRARDAPREIKYKLSTFNYNYIIRGVLST